MGKRPTIADVARAAGVSVATVDRVLNRRAAVRDATAARIADAAEAIGYHATGLLRQRLTEVPARSFGFLLQKRDAFYQALAAELIAATKAASFVRGKPVVSFVEELEPALIASRLREAGREADALAVVAIEHPHVNEAIEELAARGVPTFTLLTDVTAPARAGHIGADTRRAGRTAGWAIARLAHAPGPVGVLLGTHRYLSQDIAEIGFRSYFREHAPDFTVLETVVNLEDDRIAHAATLDLLARRPALKGIYLAGGGVGGMIGALRAERGAASPIVVCNELLPFTRAALIDGVIDLVLATPLAALAARTVAAMARAAGAGRPTSLMEILLPAELFISENV